MEYSNRYNNSKENGASYEPSFPVPECSGCMQDCTGIWGSLYDPVNAPGTPLLCANRLVPEVTV